MPVGLGGEQGWWCPTLDDSPDDISGNGNNGTYISGMGTVADTGSGGTRAYLFDGVNDYVNCGDVLDVGSGDRSWALWVKSIASLGSNKMVMDKRYSNDRQLLYLPAANAYPTAVFGDGSFIVAAGSSRVDDSIWRHFVFLLDRTANEVRLYIDGILTSTAGAVGFGSQNNGSNLIFGSGQTTSGAQSNSYCINGRMDDIRGYDRTITQAEITYLATARGVLGGPGSDGYNAFTSAIYNPRNYNNKRFG